MNRNTPLLISTALNAVLVGVVCYLANELRHANEKEPVVATSLPIADSQRPALPAPITTNRTESTLNWSQVESQDYKDYMRNLRALGCPEDTVRDIIAADVKKLYDQKRAALRPKTTAKYWEKGFDEGLTGSEKRQTNQRLRELDIEQKRVLTDLLGADAVKKLESTPVTASQDDAAYGSLSTEKREKVQAWEQKYLEMEYDLQSRSVAGVLSAEDEQAIRQLKIDQQEELAKILSPQEILDYEVRNSFTARALRDNLSGMPVTEQEFRTLYQWQKEFNSQIGDPSQPSSAALEQKRAQAQQQFDAQIRSLLGENRYNEYQRNIDPAYQTLRQLAQNYDLPTQTAAAVYDLQKNALAQQDKLTGDPALSAQQRSVAKTQIQTQTDNAIRSLLGDKAYQLFLKSQAP